jgi:hypothetical protein
MTRSRRIPRPGPRDREGIVGAAASADLLASLGSGGRTGPGARPPARCSMPVARSGACVRGEPMYVCHISSVPATSLRESRAAEPGPERARGLELVAPAIHTTLREARSRSCPGTGSTRTPRCRQRTLRRWRTRISPHPGQITAAGAGACSACRVEKPRHDILLIISIRRPGETRPPKLASCAMPRRRPEATSPSSLIRVTSRPCSTPLRIQRAERNLRGRRARRARDPADHAAAGIDHRADHRLGQRDRR